LHDGTLLVSIVQGLITLLHKGGDRLPLNNYRPITLLNTTYKIFAKLLQRHLQPILMELISFDQSAFFPLRYILDNIVLTQETLHWAKTSKQPLILLKLDYTKVYDRIAWSFLFQAMEVMGFGRTIIDNSSPCWWGHGGGRAQWGPIQMLSDHERNVPGLSLGAVLISDWWRSFERKAAKAGRQDTGNENSYHSEAPADKPYAIEILAHFCQVSGLASNWAKSAAY
jgi:hypothetical protein